VTTHKKPSANEDEYFVKRDAELLRQQRQAAQRAATEAERKSHYMRCPKCGFDLFTGDWHGIQIDQCTHCHGLWLDAGEAEPGEATMLLQRAADALIAANVAA